MIKAVVLDVAAHVIVEGISIQRSLQYEKLVLRTSKLFRYIHSRSIVRKAKLLKHSNMGTR
jgi:hypothetical protein